VAGFTGKAGRGREENHTKKKNSRKSDFQLHVSMFRSESG
jgi:hypothetical protein